MKKTTIIFLLLSLFQLSLYSQTLESLSQANKLKIKNLIGSLSVANKGVLYIIHTGHKPIKMYRTETLSQKSFFTIQKNNSKYSERAYIFDIVKNNKYGFSLRVLDDKGNLGWISSCELMDQYPIYIDGIITNLNDSNYNEETYFINEIKKIFGINNKPFLHQNNELRSFENKRRFNNQKVLFGCGYETNELTITPYGKILLSNGREIKKVKDKNILSIVITKSDSIFVNEEYLSLKKLKWKVLKFLDNGGGIGKAKDNNHGKPCNYCRGEKRIESSDHPNKAIVSIQNLSNNISLSRTLKDEIRKAYTELWARVSKNEENLNFNLLTCSKRSEIINTYYPVNIIYDLRKTFYKKPKIERIPPPIPEKIEILPDKTKN